ncbi:class II aldolase/adducin family protein [Dactylosporangium sp. CA-092794]|uniref:class II aldolase/adducin family protein n=1 Tax=Dactylosporangium sp. CA-092794 TaxID=3239929 RepID=UPI003D8C4019
MNDEQLQEDLVHANWILANQGVLDAYGHVSVRSRQDPGTFYQSRSRSAEHVQRDDIMRFNLDGNVVDGTDDRPPYLERFIHGAIYEARPEVQCVLHAHTEAVLPFTVTETPFVPVFHNASALGGAVAKWDIRTRFGDTDLLVTNLDQGRDLAGRLGGNAMVLMRGHGYALAGATVVRTVGTAIDVAVNARVLLAAHQLGGPITTLSKGECLARGDGPPGSSWDPDGPAVRRGWDYWLARAISRRHGHGPSPRNDGNPLELE